MQGHQEGILRLYIQWEEEEEEGLVLNYKMVLYCWLLVLVEELGGLLVAVAL